jgi:hypothetical protein
MAKRSTYTLLNGVTATGAGTAVTPEHFRGDHENLNAIIRGITTATVAIEVSLDGTNFVAITSQTADWAGKVADFPYIRANVTAYTSGTITVQIEY